MMPQDLYNMNTYMQDEIHEMQMLEEDLEECYPEIYRVVYPMVKKVCKRNTKPVTKKLIDEMVEEIFMNVEPKEQIKIVIVRIEMLKE